LARWPYSTRETVEPGAYKLPIVDHPYNVLYTVDEAKRLVIIDHVRHSSLLEPK
jgi:hypothetical protein